jgi:hypothetical protein
MESNLLLQKRTSKAGPIVGTLSLAQSFSPFLAQDGRQVCRPSWIWATSLCYILLNKFVALAGSGRQVCRPSRDKKGLKDWAVESHSFVESVTFDKSLFMSMWARLGRFLEIYRPKF